MRTIKKWFSFSLLLLMTGIGTACVEEERAPYSGGEGEGFCPAFSLFRQEETGEDHPHPSRKDQGEIFKRRDCRVQ